MGPPPPAPPAGAPAPPGPLAPGPPAVSPGADAPPPGARGPAPHHWKAKVQFVKAAEVPNTIRTRVAKRSMRCLFMALGLPVDGPGMRALDFAGDPLREKGVSAESRGRIVTQGDRSTDHSATQGYVGRGDPPRSCTPDLRLRTPNPLLLFADKALVLRVVTWVTHLEGLDLREWLSPCSQCESLLACVSNSIFTQTTGPSAGAAGRESARA